MTVLEPQGAVRTRTGTTPSSGGLITSTASTMGVDVGHKRVRAVGGGHSARHAERHEAAGYRTSYAPVWTDSAARAVLEQLKADMAAWHTKKVGDYCVKVLSSDRDTASLLERTSRKLSLHDRGIDCEECSQRPSRSRGCLSLGLR